ncbi:MAG: hypothetical protein WED04_11310 [Promethearchaeati archaeon SRVP18_Atabeyarchaeia-1]
MKIRLEEGKVKDTIEHVDKPSFTVLDFIEMFKALHPDDWDQLAKRFGGFGEKRRYTVNTYFSNRLDAYSQKPTSLLVPFVRYKQGGFNDYRRTTEEERKVFGSPWIAMFNKREKA